MSESARIKYLTSGDGTRIWAEAAGDPAQPAVVFVHGLSCTALAFDAQFSDPAMLKGLHMVRYEMRGHGRSGMPEALEAYDSVRHAEDFRAVCEAFKLVKPFVLGWSLGGSIPVDIVTHLGASYITGVVYVGGPVLSLKLNEECLHPVFLALIPQICSADSAVVAQSASAFVDSCIADPASLPYGTRLLWLGGFCAQTPTVRHISLMRRQQDDTFWRSNSRKLPVLIVQGTLDTHCLYEKMLEQARQVYDSVAVLLIDGVGHAPQFERPAETNAAILDFVGRTAANEKN